MKKFSIALLVLALCLVSLAVSASETTLSAGAVATGDAITVNVKTTGDVAVLAMRDSALVSADALTALTDAVEKIVFVDQLTVDGEASVTFIPKDGVSGSAITIFVGSAGNVVALELTDGGFVSENISADAGYYMNEAITEYAISVTADVDAAAAANVKEYGFSIYRPDIQTARAQKVAALDDETAFAVIATGIPVGAEATEVYFKPYIVLEDETVYWGAARAYTVEGLGGANQYLGDLAAVMAD